MARFLPKLPHFNVRYLGRSPCTGETRPTVLHIQATNSIVCGCGCHVSSFFGEVTGLCSLLELEGETLEIARSPKAPPTETPYIPHDPHAKTPAADPNQEPQRPPPPPPKPNPACKSSSSSLASDLRTPLTMGRLNSPRGPLGAVGCHSTAGAAAVLAVAGGGTSSPGARASPGAFLALSMRIRMPCWANRGGERSENGENTRIPRCA